MGNMQWAVQQSSTNQPAVRSVPPMASWMNMSGGCPMANAWPYGQPVKMQMLPVQMIRDMTRSHMMYAPVTMENDCAKHTQDTVGMALEDEQIAQSTRHEGSCTADTNGNAANVQDTTRTFRFGSVEDPRSEAP